MNQLDPIEELYDMYLEKEDTPRIVELGDDGLDFISDVEEPASPYMDLYVSNQPRVAAVPKQKGLR